jgi:hypothetical protein
MTISTGYGTYISAAVVALATFAKAMGWIDDETFKMLLGAGNAGGLVFLRGAVANADAKNATANAAIAQQVGMPADVIASKVDPSTKPQP